jgi:hypothetical protein
MTKAKRRRLALIHVLANISRTIPPVEEEPREIETDINSKDTIGK